LPSCYNFAFCIKIKNIIPFFSLFLFKNKYCALNGGRNDYEAFDIINLGKTNVCTTSEALSVLDGDI
jgi:hypothetical protein